MQNHNRNPSVGKLTRRPSRHQQALARELRRQRDRAELERRWREFMTRGGEA